MTMGDTVPRLNDWPLREAREAIPRLTCLRTSERFQFSFQRRVSSRVMTLHSLFRVHGRGIDQSRFRVWLCGYYLRPLEVAVPPPTVAWTPVAGALMLSL
jgi:hypothetical protein